MGIHELKAIYENLLYPIFGELFRIDDSDEDKNWVVIILEPPKYDSQKMRSLLSLPVTFSY